MRSCRTARGTLSVIVVPPCVPLLSQVLLQSFFFSRAPFAFARTPYHALPYNLCSLLLAALSCPSFYLCCSHILFVLRHSPSSFRKQRMLPFSLDAALFPQSPTLTPDNVSRAPHVSFIFLPVYSFFVSCQIGSLFICCICTRGIYAPPHPRHVLTLTPYSLPQVFSVEGILLQPLLLRCLAHPSGIAVGPGDVLYVSETLANRVLRLVQKPRGIFQCRWVVLGLGSSEGIAVEAGGVMCVCAWCLHCAHRITGFLSLA